MSDTQNRINPIVAIAAVSVIILSGAGLALITGIIPSSLSESGPQSTAPGRSSPKIKLVQTPGPSIREPVRSAAARTCAECGTVSVVQVVEREGDATGLGAVAGGVVGGVLGNQIGDGRGRRVATVAGAAGGAYAGHQIEKNMNRIRRWDVVVRMDDGGSRTFSYNSEPSFRGGDKVKVVDGSLVAN